MSTKPGTGRVRSVYEFLKTHRGQYSVQAMCRILGVAPSGFGSPIVRREPLLISVTEGT